MLGSFISLWRHCALWRFRSEPLQNFIAFIGLHSCVPYWIVIQSLARGTNGQWMNEWLHANLNASLQRMLCRRPSTRLSWSTFHPAPPALYPGRLTCVDQLQPLSSLASSWVWQVGWVNNSTGCDRIGCVPLLNTFPTQFPSLGFTNFSPSLLLQT